MGTATQIPVDEYLRTSYDPDRDYLAGQLVERNVGEVEHSDAQGNAYFYLRSRYKNIWAGVEVRVQVKPDRFRVPDVAIVRGRKPQARIVTEPPFAVIEVLSPEDRAGDLQARIDDYLAFGIAFVWVINPTTRKEYVNT